MARCRHRAGQCLGCAVLGRGGCPRCRHLERCASRRTLVTRSRLRCGRPRRGVLPVSPPGGRCASCGLAGCASEPPSSGLGALPLRCRHLGSGAMKPPSFGPQGASLTSGLRHGVCVRLRGSGPRVRPLQGRLRCGVRQVSPPDGRCTSDDLVRSAGARLPSTLRAAPLWCRHQGGAASERLRPVRGCVPSLRVLRHAPRLVLPPTSGMRVLPLGDPERGGACLVSPPGKRCLSPDPVRSACAADVTIGDAFASQPAAALDTDDP